MLDKGHDEQGEEQDQDRQERGFCEGEADCYDTDELGYGIAAIEKVLFITEVKDQGFSHVSSSIFTPEGTYTPCAVIIGSRSLAFPSATTFPCSRRMVWSV